MQIDQYLEDDNNVYKSYSCSEITGYECVPLNNYKPVKQLRKIVKQLYQILDDIDTADDLAKDDDAGYRKLISKIQQYKAKHIWTDGYNLFVIDAEMNPEFEAIIKAYNYIKEQMGSDEFKKYIAGKQEKQISDEIQEKLPEILNAGKMVWCRNGSVSNFAVPCAFLSCKYKSNKKDIVNGVSKCQQFQITKQSDAWGDAVFVCEPCSVRPWKGY